MRQNVVFSTKNKKNFLGRRHSPSSDPSPSGEGDAPWREGDAPPQAHPPRRLRHLDPSHSKILGTPLKNVQ